MKADERFRKETGLWKETQGCSSCGEKYVPLLYHHVDPTTKKYDVGAMEHKTVEELYDEIAKCIVLCIPCHRRRHRTIAWDDRRLSDIAHTKNDDWRSPVICRGSERVVVLPEPTDGLGNVSERKSNDPIGGVFRSPQPDPGSGSPWLDRHEGWK